MLFSSDNRKIIEIMSDKNYHFVGDKCKRCCKTCLRHCKDKDVKKDICHFIEKDDPELKKNVIAFYNVDSVEILVYPGYVCKRWKPKKAKKK